MNDTPLHMIDIELENAIIVFQRAIASIMLVTSIPVCALIFTNKDIRNRKYRKYELSVQFSSILLELWFCMGVPIFMPNYRIVFMAGYLPSHMNSVLYTIVYITFVCEIGNSYVSCIYDRRNALRASDSNKWKNVSVYILLKVYSFITFTALFLLLKKIQLPIEGTSIDQSRLINYSWVLLLDINAYAIAFSFVMLIWGASIILIFYRLCFESMREVKHGMKHASASTKEYQRRAISTLLLQVLIPSVVYIIPILFEILVFLHTFLFETQTSSHNPTVTTISAIIFNMIALHTILHSITIVASSPAHRRRLLSMIGRNSNVLIISLASPTKVNE